MTTILRHAPALLLAFAVFGAAWPAQAQVFEAVGVRALGMGGAFVAVADDSTATWWNPGGLAAGPFLDLSVGVAGADIDEAVPARRDRAWWVTAASLPFGFSYYRLRITDIGEVGPTGGDDGGREDERAGVPVRTLSVSQTGATLVHTIVSGVHAGTTLKYVRGSAADTGVPGETAATLGIPGLLDAGEDLETGDATGAFDLDVGVLAVREPIRVGVTVRNVLEPEPGGRTLPRQFRTGVALGPFPAGPAEVTASLDADLATYETPFGDRRVIAVGGESWWLDRRVGVRAGARFNAVGEEERAVTAGATVAVWSALLVEGYIAGGGARAEEGWGIAARVSY